MFVNGDFKSYFIFSAGATVRLVVETNRSEGCKQEKEIVMAVHKATQETFDDDVVNAASPVLVDFYADWCAPCRALAPIVEELSSEYEGRVDVVKVDIDQARSLAQTYDIRGIPTLVLFKDGAPVESLIGARSKADLQLTLEQHI